MTTRTPNRPGLALVTAAQARAVTQDTMKGLEKMIAQSEKFDTKKADYSGAAQSFRFNGAGKLSRDAIVGTKAGKLFSEPKSPLLTGFTDAAMGQFLSRMSSTFFADGSNRTMDRQDWQTMQRRFPKQFVAVMNELLKGYTEGGKRDLMVRTFNKQVRAVFTDLYGIVQNTAMLHALHEILAPEAANLPEMKLVRSEVTPDNLLVQVVWKNPTPQPGTQTNEPGNFGVGVAIRNGETGGNGIKVSPMIWRHSCTNSIIVKDDRAINLRHIGSPAALMAKIKVGMLDCLPLAAQSLQEIYKAEVTRLPSIADVINGFAQEYKWSDTITDAVMIGTEGQTTKMGVLNGISYAAHAATEGNTDLMVDMSTLAGTLLFAPVSRFENAAKRVK